MEDPDEIVLGSGYPRWLSAAAGHEGSWWPGWAGWLISRSGAEKPAPAKLDSREYPPLGPAPGTYVHQ